MEKITVAMVMGAALFWVLPPSGAQLLIDFDEPSYSSGPLDGQDNWQADENAVVTWKNCSSAGGYSLVGGWPSTHALDQTYTDGIVYLSYYIYWNGDYTDGNNDPPMVFVSLTDDDGRRSHLGGRWSQGVPGVRGDFEVLSSFVDAGWYFYDTALDLEHQSIHTEIIEVSTGESEILEENYFASGWGGVPEYFSKVSIFLGSEGQCDRIAVGRERVEMIIAECAQPPVTGFTSIDFRDVSALEFQSETGIVYQLQSNTDTNIPNNWVDIDRLILGTGGTQWAVDPTSSVTEKAYRIAVK